MKKNSKLQFHVSPLFYYDTNNLMNNSKVTNFVLIRNETPLDTIYSINKEKAYFNNKKTKRYNPLSSTTTLLGNSKVKVSLLVTPHHETPPH